MTQQQRTPLVEDVEPPPPDAAPLFIEPSPRPSARAVRLHHTTLVGIQVLVSDVKAERLIASGDYKAAPDDEQPTQEPAVNEQFDKSTPGPTSIAAALREGAGPMWDTTT